MHNYLDFEKPISDLEGKIHELKKIASEDAAGSGANHSRPVGTPSSSKGENAANAANPTTTDTLEK